MNTLTPFIHMWDGHLSHVKVTEGRIELTSEATEMFQPPYRTGKPLRMKEIEEELEMVNIDVIEPSNAEWISPFVRIKKKDGSIRFCVDYRHLSKGTKG